MLVVTSLLNAALVVVEKRAGWKERNYDLDVGDQPVPFGFKGSSLAGCCCLSSVDALCNGHC